MRSASSPAADARLRSEEIGEIADFRAIDDWAAELEEIVDVVIVCVGGDGPGVSEALGFFARAVSFDDAGCDDGDLAVESVDGECMNCVAEPIEIAANAGGRADGEIE